MSLGLAIVLSVLAVIIVWQIDKHGAWRNFWRTVSWLLGIGLLAAVTVGVWLYWVRWTNEREQRAKAEVVRAGQLREYWGIKLGDNKNAVLYLKGEPTERGEKGDDTNWMYGHPHSHQVWFHRGEPPRLFRRLHFLEGVQGVWTGCSRIPRSSLFSTRGPCAKAP